VEEDNLSGIIRGLRVDFMIIDDVQKPQCIFAQVLGNGSTKPAWLKAHFTSLHPTNVNDNNICSRFSNCAPRRSGGSFYFSKGVAQK